MARSTLSFNKGCLWEEYPWSIEFHVRIKVYDADVICEHCHSTHTEKNEIGESETWTICPSVVVARNEGDYNSTGVCLQCIVQQAAKL